MSGAPQAQIAPLRERMGWTLPWYSSYATGLHEELGTYGWWRLHDEY